MSDVLFVMILFLLGVIYYLSIKLARMTGQRDGWMKNYHDVKQTFDRKERIVYLQEKKIKHLSQLLVDLKPIEPVLVDRKINKLVD